MLLLLLREEISKHWWKSLLKWLDFSSSNRVCHLLLATFMPLCWTKHRIVQSRLTKNKTASRRAVKQEQENIPVRQTTLTWCTHKTYTFQIQPSNLPAHYRAQFLRSIMYDIAEHRWHWCCIFCKLQWLSKVCEIILSAATGLYVIYFVFQNIRTV